MDSKRTASHGRHTPAFLLLLLSDGPSYGARLLARFEAEVPHCLVDSAIVYRSLVRMEKQGLVETKWNKGKRGQPRKWYTISDKGRKALADYANDIERRSENLRFFLERYSAAEKTNGA